MKIGLFSDPHYSTAPVTCEKRYNNQSLFKIQTALDHFRAENCDLVICLGDLIDTEDDHAQEIINLQKVAALFHASPLKIIAVMGNHDAFRFEVEEFYRILGEQYRPQLTSMERNHFLFLDACYFKTGIHYMPGDEDWTDTCFPHTDNLERTLAALDGNIYVFLHQNIDPAVCPLHRLYNAAEICSIIGKYSNVRAVYQGHYHPGMQSEYEGVPYITLPAMCENTDAYYVIEI